jgi:hypothetical protein
MVRNYAILATKTGLKRRKSAALGGELLPSPAKSGQGSGGEGSTASGSRDRCDTARRLLAHADPHPTLP